MEAFLLYDSSVRAIDAEIDEVGKIHVLQQLPVGARRRAVVIIADDDETGDVAQYSEEALAADWDRPEEHAAWSHLHEAR